MRGRALQSLISILSVAVLLTGQSGRVGHLHAQELPPLSYVCPMAADAEVVEDKPGKCRICNMDLVPVRLDTAWSCPNHAAVIRDKEGKCPIDKRDLVQVIVAKHWECPDKPNTFLGEPGKCADGSARKLVTELRAHEDHNPRHGGLFFMAENKWHHLEGTYPNAGLFRIFLYDNFTKPLPAKGAQGRVFIEENGKEVASVPLTPSKDGQTLEARLKGVGEPSAAAPVKLATRLKINEKTPEQRFDFAFTELSKEPAVAPTTTSAAPATQKPTAKAADVAASKPAERVPAPPPAPAAPPAPPPAAEPSPAVATAAAVSPSVSVSATALTRADAEQLAQNLPSSPKELLTLLGQRVQEVETAVKDGQFGYIYIPSLLSKDIALALDGHNGALAEQRQVQVSAAIRRLVLTAWQLDFYGDLGNKEKITDTYNTFAAAFADIKAAYDAR